MRTVVVGERPAELEQLIERRRALGLDRYDEIWDGDYHMKPTPNWDHQRLGVRLIELLAPLARAAGLEIGEGMNLGEVGNFRVPDVTITDIDAPLTFLPTSTLVVEILSPYDESYEKFAFYFARGVIEVCIVDPARKRVELYGRGPDGFVPIEASTVLDVTVVSLDAGIDWPS